MKDNFKDETTYDISWMLETSLHPWGEFLNARNKAILWMKNELGYDDEKIAFQLSMDKEQVRLIRTHYESYPIKDVQE